MRKVIVLVQSTGKKSIVEGEFKTLGDLKEAMTNEGVEYPSVCEFKEGRTKTIFVDDAAVLPTNVEWKGVVSDDLTVYVTAPKSKIASGGELSRAELYDFIKKNNLQEEVKKTFGRVFSSVSTDKLNAFVSSYNTPTKTSSGLDEFKKTVEDALKDAYNDDRMSLNTLNLLMHKIFGVEMTETSEEDMSFEELLGEYNF